MIIYINDVARWETLKYCLNIVFIKSAWPPQKLFRGLKQTCKMTIYILYGFVEMAFDELINYFRSPLDLLWVIFKQKRLQCHLHEIKIKQTNMKILIITHRINGRPIQRHLFLSSSQKWFQITFQPTIKYKLLSNMCPMS